MSTTRVGPVWIPVSFLAGGGVALVLLDRLLRLESDNLQHGLLEFAGIGFSTFVGAWAAFLLQSHRDDVKARADRAAALRRAQFALNAQFIVLEHIRRQQDPVRTDPDRDVRLKAFLYYREAPPIDLSSLNFLLESTNDPDLLSTLHACQNLWNIAIGVLQQRSREHRRFLERVAAAIQARATPEDSTPEQMRAVVGPELRASLRSLTNALYKSLDEAVTANAQAFKRLSAQFGKQFPGERILTRHPDAGGPVVASAPLGAAKTP